MSGPTPLRLIAAMLAVALLGGACVALEPEPRVTEYSTTNVRSTPTTAAEGSFRNPFVGGVTFTQQGEPTWSFDVISVEDGADDMLREEMFNEGPRPGHRSLLVRLRATYHGGDDGNLVLFEYGAITTGGTQIDGCQAWNIPDSLDGNLVPGASKEGNVCIEAPVGQTPMLIIRPLFWGDAAVVRLPNTAAPAASPPTTRPSSPPATDRPPGAASARAAAEGEAAPGCRTAHLSFHAPDSLLADKAERMTTYARIIQQCSAEEVADIARTYYYGVPDTPYAGGLILALYCHTLEQGEEYEPACEGLEERVFGAEGLPEPEMEEWLACRRAQDTLIEYIDGEKASDFGDDPQLMRDFARVVQDCPVRALKTVFSERDWPTDPGTLVGYLSALCNRVQESEVKEPLCERWGWMR